MKTIIAGSRTFKNYKYLEIYLDRFHSWTITQIVSGTCYGPDKFGEAWAAKKNIEVERFPADWDFYGKRAGYTTNYEMAEYADAAIVFWDGTSKGSKHMIDIMKNLKKPVDVVLF